MKKLYTFIILHLIIYNLNNALAQCTNPTITLNLPDTTIGFKQDSILLDAGAGYTTYSWNTGASTRFVWAKNQMKYKVTVTLGSSCGTDSIVVLFVKGIQQKDTTICAGSSINLSIPGSLPRNGLVGWWPFNGNANDESGNGNNGTVNGATLTTDRIGKTNSAFQFNGINNRIIVNDSGEQLDLINDFTISSFFNLSNNIPAGSIAMILAKRSNTISNISGALAGFGVFDVNDGSGREVISLQASSNAGPQNYPTSAGDIQTNRWYHFVATYNKSNDTLKYYLDGINVFSKRLPLGIINTPYNLSIGSISNVGYYFNGKIDDIGIWKRTLSQQEITALYGGGINGQSKVQWSTNDTTTSITVTPTANTRYRCTQRIGSYTFIDSILVSVVSIPTVSLPDTNIAFKADSILLNAGVGHTKYVWSTGDTTQTIWAKNASVYKVTVQNAAGCSATDSTQVLFVKGIQQKDTTICAGSSINLSIPGSLPRNGLVGWWPFNGNANDESGNGNHGFINGVTNTTDRFGKFNSAYSFSLNKFISGNCNNLPTGNRTISIWFNSDSIGGINGTSLLGYGGGVCGTSYLQLMNNPFNGGNQFEVQGHCNNQLTTHNYGINNHPKGAWFHWIVTSDSIVGTKFYLNGNLIYSNNIFLNQTNVVNKIFIFGGSVSNDGNSYYYDAGGMPIYGKLDDIGIWNRALSQQEVTALYGGGINSQSKVQWSTNDTTTSITITPTANATYRCTQRIGSYTFTDSIRVSVASLPTVSLPDTSIAFKADSILLDAGAGHTKYVWSTGDTTQTIWAKSALVYKVTVQNSVGCSATDSTQVLFVKGIQQKDTTICAGSSINLSIPGSLPRNGLVGWWPFNGNANDESGNGNHGNIVGSALASDRFGSINRSVNQTLNGSYIRTQGVINNAANNFTISLWARPTNSDITKSQGVSGSEGYGIRSIIHPAHGANWGTSSTNAGAGINVGNNQIQIVEHTHNFIGSPLVYNTALTGWNHITLVYDQHLPKLYLNGVLVATGLISPITNIHPSSGFCSIYSQSGFGNSFTPNGNPIGNYKGDFDDIAIWNRALSQQEITALYNGSANTQSKVQWSTNDTTTSITVSPTTNTTYRCTQRIGSYTFTDSIRVSVASLPVVALSDTTIAFKADSILLDAGAGHTKYVWNTGDTTQTIWAKNASVYKVTVQNAAGCSATDSTQVLFVKGIQQKDTTICAGSSINLSIPGSLPRNGLVGWWPFNGNANDESGNGNNGTVNGATLTTDRIGKNNSAYSFANSFISVNPFNALTGSNPFSVSFWTLASGGGWMIACGQINEGKGFDAGNNNSGIGYFHTQIYKFGRTSPLTSISNSNWIHLTIVFSNMHMKVYRDGVLTMDDPVNYVNPDLQTGTLQFGKQLLFNEYFQGKLDDIGIWNRALTQQEITALYNDNANTQSKVLWSTNDTAASITVSPTTNTTYTCTQTIGSFGFTDSVRVSIRNLPDKIVNTPKLGLCKDDSIALTAASGYTYQWKRGNNSLAQTQIINAAEAGAYTVTLTDNVGCKNTSDTIRIFNAPLPKSIIATKDSGQCIRGNLFIFKDSTQLDSGSYTVHWNFGNGVTSTLSNPSNSYAAVGVYPVKLISTTNYGCKDSIVRQVIVHPNPTTGPMLGDSFNLKTSTPYFYTIAQQLNHSYNWQINNGIVVAGQNTNAATVQWLSNGSGSVKVVVTNPQGCTDTSSKQVSIGNVGLNELSTLRAFHVYPNPSNGSFTISMQAKNATAVEMRLVNLLGQTIWSQTNILQAGENELTANAPLAPGMYTLIVDENNNRLQQKIVIK